MNPLRIVALVFFAAGTVMLVLDGMQRMLSSNWNGMALGYLWSVVAPGALRGTQLYIEGSVSVTLWQQILLPLLSLPAWAALLAAGGVFYLAGKRFED